MEINGRQHSKRIEDFLNPLMFFGMCNSPATFQSMMDATFKDLIEEGIIIIYMDDLFLFTKDLTSLEENTKQVLQRLRDNDLYLKP